MEDMWFRVSVDQERTGGNTHMSRGYTSAFAMTAPVAPATARPHGGIKASFDCPAIATLGGEDTYFNVCGCPNFYAQNSHGAVLRGTALDFSVARAWGDIV
jgi:hypothetical protein